MSQNKVFWVKMRKKLHSSNIYYVIYQNNVILKFKTDSVTFLGECTMGFVFIASANIAIHSDKCAKIGYSYGVCICIG